MTKIDIAALVADREAGTKGPWIAQEESGQKTAHGIASNIGVWSQQRWDDAYEANPDDMGEAEDAAWILGIWGEIGDEDRANARRIARVPDMEAALIAQDAELKRLREALAEIAEIKERKKSCYPPDWQDQINTCPECQRYKDRPIQRGICDDHRRPIYAQKDHDMHETRILGYRAQSIARAALGEKP